MLLSILSNSKLYVWDSTYWCFHYYKWTSVIYFGSNYRL